VADTVDALEIGDAWVDLNTLAGITVGTGIILQNLGAASGAIINIGTPDAVIEITTNSSAPDPNFVGWHVQQNEQWTVSSGDPKVWVRFSRLSGAPVGTELARIKVQTL